MTTGDEIKAALRVALRAHYRGILATRLGLSLAEHYAGEASRIAVGPLAEAVRGSRKALARAEEALRGEDAQCRVGAEEELRLVYRKLPLRLGVRLEDCDTQAFWSLVEDAISPTFSLIGQRWTARRGRAMPVTDARGGYVGAVGKPHKSRKVD
jgi:hypothetical protein